jgi:hypothetical protein
MPCQLQNNDDMERTPQKVNQTANTQTGLPMETMANHANAITGMIREWYKDSGKMGLPPDLMALALQAGINPAEILPGQLFDHSQEGQTQKRQPPLPLGMERSKEVSGGGSLFSQACGPTLKKKQG